MVYREWMRVEDAIQSQNGKAKRKGYVLAVVATPSKSFQSQQRSEFRKIDTLRT
jgi:hypothetical protein